MRGKLLAVACMLSVSCRPSVFDGLTDLPDDSGLEGWTQGATEGGTTEDASNDSDSDASEALDASAVPNTIDSGVSSVSSQPTVEAGACPPGPAECEPGEVDLREQPCGACQQGSHGAIRMCLPQTCRWSEWQEWNRCEVRSTECSPGEEQELPAASCGTMCGVARVTRVCSDSCSWGPAVEGTCVSAGACVPGTEQELAPVACGTMCGRAQAKRVCSASCTWNEPVTAQCTELGECTPGATRVVGPAGACGPCGKGVPKQTETCSSDCTWSATATTCELPGNVCAPEGYEGSSGWHCVGNGQREWCYVATVQPPELACTWTGGREPYSGCP